MMDYHYETIDWARLREYRKKRVFNVMKERELEALLIFESPNVRYLADIREYVSPDTYSELNFLVFGKNEEMIAFSQIFHELIPERFPWIKKAYNLPAWRKASLQYEVRSNLVVKALTELGITSGKIGIDYLPYQVKECLQNKVKLFEFVSVYNDLQKTRMIKNDDEIRLMELAASNNEIGMRAGLDAISEGVSEYDIISAIIGAMARAGIEGLTHYPGCRSGERTLYHYLPVGRKLRRGDTVIMDIGNYGVGGYACDFCRTGIVGKPSDNVQRAYYSLLKAHMKGIDAIKPGTMATEIHEVINESLKRDGYPEPIYANGHGIGISMIELPTIGEVEYIEEDIELKEGMTVCIEPITFVEEGAVKLEDVILVTADGRRVLTRTEYWET